jgi:serine-type D-Ala-D-Ala carboxypeptidase/endopeptidase
MDPQAKPLATNVALNRRSLIGGALALTITGVHAMAQRDTPSPTGLGNGSASPLRDAGVSADAIRVLLAERVDVGRDSVGYVAAIRDADDTQLVTCGTSGSANGRALDGDTVFEIGSITKVFTALLLADMVARGEVALTDPVMKYLPLEGRPQPFDGKPISLLDLATYTSGLPRLPGNLSPQDPTNPYADYTVAQLYEFLSGYTPQYYPGSQYVYTNLGFGLLGHVLALRAGRSYEELIVSRLCAPLGLDDTRTTLTSVMQERLAQGHDGSLRDAPGWDLPTLAGAGALRSTANDLLRFLDACQGRRETSLAPALASLLDVRRQTDQRDVYAAAGWFVQAGHNDELVVKSGGTGGYSTFVGYSARTRVAAVLLSNAASWHTTPALGLHLLNANFPLPTLHRQVPIDPAKLSAYAGQYPLTPHFVLTVTPRDGRLMVRATGQDEYEVFPESETRFFYRVVDAQITFELAPDGTASALVLHQNGRDQRVVQSP